eukprot:SAG22_NODE_1113_length_5533_cov_5.884063_6_plen_86_part_00
MLASMIRTTFAASKKLPPPLIGPDHYSLVGYDTVLQTLHEGTVAAITYHDYPQCLPAQATAGMVLEPSCLRKLDATAAQAAELVR